MRLLNPTVPILEVSATTGAGLEPGSMDGSGNVAEAAQSGADR